jgi:hypothetical protein
MSQDAEEQCDRSGAEQEPHKLPYPGDSYTMMQPISAIALRAVVRWWMGAQPQRQEPLEAGGQSVTLGIWQARVPFGKTPCDPIPQLCKSFGGVALTRMAS